MTDPIPPREGTNSTGLIAIILIIVLIVIAIIWYFTTQGNNGTVDTVLDTPVIEEPADQAPVIEPEVNVDVDTPEPAPVDPIPAPADDAAPALDEPAPAVDEPA